jgi:hypothetical protein
MTNPDQTNPDQQAQSVPPTLSHPAAGRFWLAVIAAAALTGADAAALTRRLQVSYCRYGRVAGT